MNELWHLNNKSLLFFSKSVFNDLKIIKIWQFYDKSNLTQMIKSKNYFVENESINETNTVSQAETISSRDCLKPPITQRMAIWVT